MSDLYIKVKSAGTAEWERPDDWLAMPSVTSADDTFVGLHTVFPSGSNFVAFTFTTDTGDYQVDWGDGNTDIVASNTQVQHQYDYSTYDTGSTTLSSRGYKQAIITVIPVSGELRTANFQKRYTTTPTINYAYSSGFLDCILSMPNANTGKSITFGGSTVNHNFTQRFNIKTIGNATSMQSMFTECNSLQNIPLFDTSNVTTMQSMFQNCNSLQNIPLFNTSNVSDMQYMFQGCSSLQTIPLIDTSNVTIMRNMFTSCNSLQSIPLLDTSGVTSLMNSMFQGCQALKTIPSLDISNTTNTYRMFFGCFSLQIIPSLDTSNSTNMQEMFRECYSLQTVPPLNTTSTNNQSSQFLFCYSLTKTDIICRKSVRFDRALLSQSELVNIFNNLIDLTGLTSQNIRISDAWGASALTAGERQIATDKNWTITG
jgi:surface protein